MALRAKPRRRRFYTFDVGVFLQADPFSIPNERSLHTMPNTDLHYLEPVSYTHLTLPTSDLV